MPRLSHPAPVRPIVPAVALLALLAVCPAARAAFVDYDVTRARLAMQRADYLLSDAEFAADVARDDFERADRRAAELAQEIDRQQRDVDDISRRFDEAVRSVKWLREDLERGVERVNARQKELDAVAERLRGAREAVDKLLEGEVERFEAGEQFKSLAAAVDEAGKVVEAAEKASLERLAETDEHRAARTVADAVRTRVEFLTEQGDRTAPDELEAAKKELSDAQDRLRRMEDRHLESDAAVKEAEMRLAQAEQAIKSLQEEFDRQLGERPEVADARTGAAAEQQAYDDALRALRDAEARVADAEEQLRRQDEVVALEHDRLKAANDHLNRLLDEVREADAFAAASDRRLSDALEAVECARRERDAASWSLARAQRFADAFYSWDAPVHGLGWTVVQVGRVDCRPRPRPIFIDPDCHRPSWCRPLADFKRPIWAHSYYRRPIYDDCRPVTVKIVKVHHPAIHRVRETARENAIRVADRNAGDEQRRQRRAVVETRRQEVAQRQIRLAGFGSHAGSQGAAAIAADRANDIERRQRQQALQTERATRAAAARADNDQRSEAKQAVDAHNRELRQRQQAEAALARRQVPADPRQRQMYKTVDLAQDARREARKGEGNRGGGSVSIKPARTARAEGEEGRRLRWAERREIDQREREQKQQARRKREQEMQAAAAAVAGRPAVPTHSPGEITVARRSERRDGRRAAEPLQAPAAPDGAQQSKAAERAAGQQAEQQRRREREAAQQLKVQQDAMNERAKRRQRQQEAPAERAGRDQREQERVILRDAQAAARRQDEQTRRQAIQGGRQQEVESRRQRQAEEVVRGAARQQAAAEERSRHAAERAAAEQARFVQRQASRQAEQQRSAAREAARSAERAQRQAESESRRSAERQQQSNNDRSDNNGRGGRRR